jgi:hypothetical protein
MVLLLLLSCGSLVLLLFCRCLAVALVRSSRCEVIALACLVLSYLVLSGLAVVYSHFRLVVWLVVALAWLVFSMSCSIRVLPCCCLGLDLVPLLSSCGSRHVLSRIFSCIFSCALSCIFSCILSNQSYLSRGKWDHVVNLFRLVRAPLHLVVWGCDPGIFPLIELIRSAHSICSLSWVVLLDSEVNHPLLCV